MQLFHKPDIIEFYFRGILIQEPVTAITDIFITITCWYIFLRLKPYHNNALAYRLFRYFFFMMGLATLLGGIFGHAFSYAVGYNLKLPGWICSMVAVMLAERSSIVHARPLMKKQVGEFFSVLNIVELLTLVTAVSITVNFFFVEAHAFYGLLIVFGSFELYIFRKTGDEGSRWLLYSVCVSALAACVHIGYFSIHRWFNYLDLAHCLMCVSAFLLYQGVTRMSIHQAQNGSATG